MANSKFKLTYFDWTGLAEITRLIFAYAKVPYEDERLTIDEHFPALSPERKARFPWGQVPVLEVDGKQIAQARAINRFLGRRFNLAGADEFESAKCDEIVDSFMDFVTEFQKYFHEMDPEKKKEIMKNNLEVLTPKYFEKYEKIFKANSLYLVGKGYNWADFTMHHLVTYFEAFCKIEILKDYPAMKKAMETFFNVPQIKEWIAKRPKPAIDFNDEIFAEMVRKKMNLNK